MSDWLGILWLVVLLLGNAFFVGAEFAVISAKRSQIEPLADKGKRSAKTALWAMEHATLMLATSQLGITICSLLILNVSEPAIHHLLEIPLDALNIPPQVVSPLAFAIALLVVSYLHVVFGEMIPKNLSFSVPDRAVLILATPLVFMSRIFKPIIWTLNGAANVILRLFKVEPKNEAVSTFTLDEVQNIVDQSTAEGVLTDASGALVNAFEFTTKTVRDVALPLASLVTLPSSSTAADVERAVAKNGYSRYVICDEAGELSGYVHLKDVIRIDDDGEADTSPIPSKRIRSLASIHVDSDLEDALAVMRRTGAHIARVIATDGRTLGVIFLEDIIEELVGEVEDATQRTR